MRPVYKLLEIDNHQKISDDIYNYLVNHTELLKFEKYCFFNHISPIHIVQHVPSLKQFLDNNFLKMNTAHKFTKTRMTTSDNINLLQNKLNMGHTFIFRMALYLKGLQK